MLTSVKNATLKAASYPLVVLWAVAYKKPRKVTTK